MSNRPLPTTESRRVLTETDQTVRRNIARLMAQHGEISNSQTALAKRAGVDQAFISKLLKGKNSLSVAYLNRLADALGVAAWQLLVPTEWDLGNPPVLAPLTPEEKRLYALFTAAREIKAAHS